MNKKTDKKTQRRLLEEIMKLDQQSGIYNDLPYTEIETRKQYKDYCDKLESLLENDDGSDKTKKEIELLTRLIEEFETWGVKGEADLFIDLVEKTENKKISIIPRHVIRKKFNLFFVKYQNNRIFPISRQRLEHFLKWMQKIDEWDITDDDIEELIDDYMFSMKSEITQKLCEKYSDEDLKTNA